MTQPNVKAYYSDNNIDWIPARSYQMDAMIKANVWYQNNKSTYRYDTAGIIMTLTPYVSNKLEDVFIMTRENGSIAYIKLVKDQYIKMCAQPGSNITAEYCGVTINIRPGSSYYIDTYNDNKIVIGWHGSYDPPCDMGGNPLF